MLGKAYNGAIGEPVSAYFSSPGMAVGAIFLSLAAADPEVQIIQDLV